MYVDRNASGTKRAFWTSTEWGLVLLGAVICSVLVLGTGLSVRQMYLSGKPQLPDPRIALPGGYFGPFTVRVKRDFQNTEILIYT